ncbi:(Fe-S)-binding protein [Paenibacillus sp. GCM10023252]|uniref:(Fe-S)-binding protein n=1 Tax=Paenibacillus sp. GCM10023252 TaxID=3252649 RepID=UPI003613E597
MRCGFCLPACPTFKVRGVEAESPRGRIALMKAAVDGLMEPDERFEDQMSHCLGCRACEPACPADVKYGQLIEQAREAIEEHTTQHRSWVKAVRKVVFKGLFPHQNRMKLLGKGLRLYEQSGLQSVVRKTGALKLLPPHLSEMEQILPSTSGQGVAERLGTRIPAKGEKIGTVGMFRGCLMDVMFTETNEKTVKLLSAAGFDVIIPEAQNCCGALHAHSGEMAQAKELAKNNIRVFQEAGVDYIISNAGGCGAILVEYDHLLHDDPQWQEQSAWFASRVKDISSVLVERLDQSSLLSLGDKALSGGAAAATEQRATAPTAAPNSEPKHDQLDKLQPVRVTYQDSCHLRNVMKGGSAPRKLLASLPQVDYVEMADAGSCCGSAGIYNITQPEMAGELLDRKMQHANATKAHVIVTSNPGCLLQMKLGIDKHSDSDKVQAVHIVDFLYERMGLK